MQSAMLNRIGGLVTLCHNLLSDEWGDLCAKYLTPSAFYDKPRVHTGSQIKGGASRRDVK